MKTFNLGLSAILLLLVSFFLSCSDNDLMSTKSTPVKYGNSGEKYELFKSLFPEEAISPRTPISYVNEFCGYVFSENTHVTEYSRWSPAYWDYFSFYADAGAVLDIYVKRISNGMDPAFYLFSGVYTNTDDLPDPIGF